MAVTSVVIDLDVVNDEQTTINDVLTGLAIAKADFLGTEMITVQGKSQIAKIVIFYEVP